MAEESNKKNFTEKVKEVLVQTKKDTSTEPTKFEDRAKIEGEVVMIKVGKNPAGQAIWARSDRITADQKKQREVMKEKIRNNQPY